MSPDHSDLQQLALDNARRVVDRLRRYQDDPRMARQAANEGEALLGEAVAAVARVARALDGSADSSSTDPSNGTTNR